MKLKKRVVLLLAIVSVLSMFLSVTSGISENTKGYSDEELKSMSKYDKIFLEKQSKSSEVYEILNKSFGIGGNGKAKEYLVDYGGSFIDNDGELVVYLTVNNEKNRSEYIKRAGSNKIKFISAKNLFGLLTETMDTLNKYKQQNPFCPVYTNFSSYALIDADNKVVVYLDEYSQEHIDEFKNKVLDSSTIEFKKATGKFTKETNLNAGTGINIYILDYSMGYRARLNGIDGIVTAAHSNSLGDSVNKNGIIFGQIAARQFSGSVDAAFVQITNSSFIPTNMLEGTGNTLSTTISEPGAGTVVNKIGGATGQTSGKIISTNASATLNWVNFTNLTSADYESAGGDNGGIVYSYISSTNTRLTLGIHMGSNGSTRYFVKANQINSALGTSRY